MKYLIALLFSAQALAYNPTVTLEYDVNQEPSAKKSVDILFVIDNSGSMQNHQNFLSSLAKEFISIIKNVDYQIAAISTDKDQILSPYIIAPRTINAGYNLENLMYYFGTSGNPTELVFRNIESFLKTAQATELFRKGTNREIIMVTDEREQSHMDAQSVVDLFSPYHVVFNGLIPGGAEGNDENCGSFGPPSEFSAFRDIINLTQGNTINLCKEDEVKKEEYRKLAQAIIKRAGMTEVPVVPIPFLDLHQRVNIDTVEITYGSQIIPRGHIHTGWVYDSFTNRILFGRSIELTDQPTGTKFIIKYDVQ